MAFRSDNASTAGTGANTTLTAPAGIADGDILVIAFYIEDDVTPTPPTGFTQIVNADHSGVATDLWLWWKRASSESGNYTITHNSTWRQGWIGAFSGRLASGTPVEALQTVEGSGVTATIQAITPTVDGSDIIAVVGTFDSSSASTPSGATPTYTEQHDDGNNVHVYTATQTTAGNTFNKSSTVTSTSWQTVHISLKPAAGGGGDPEIALIRGGKLLHGGLLLRGGLVG